MKLPSMALARMIVKNFERDDFSLVIVDGNLRKGKSAYAMKAVEQAGIYLGIFDELDPSNLNWYMGWEPNEVVATWRLTEERQPFFIWDDAGYWLHSMNWHDDLMIAIQQYFNVIGTDYNTVILTTPSPHWVLSKIANFPEMYRIRITKRTGGKRDSEYYRFARKATAYKRWNSPDLSRGGVNKMFTDNFSCKIRDDLYDWYYPMRRSYAKEAKEKIVDNLRRKTDQQRLEDLKTMRNIRRYEKEIYGEPPTNQAIQP